MSHDITNDTGAHNPNENVTLNKAHPNILINVHEPPPCYPIAKHSTNTLSRRASAPQILSYLLMLAQMGIFYFCLI